jgi:hypothetical protein
MEAPAMAKVHVTVPRDFLESLTKTHAKFIPAPDATASAS